jgi:hypothetical protein
VRSRGEPVGEPVSSGVLVTVKPCIHPNERYSVFNLCQSADGDTRSTATILDSAGHIVYVPKIMCEALIMLSPRVLPTAAASAAPNLTLISQCQVGPQTGLQALQRSNGPSCRKLSGSTRRRGRGGPESVKSNQATRWQARTPGAHPPTTSPPAAPRQLPPRRDRTGTR